MQRDRAKSAFTPLDSKHLTGFTLIELIMVIAITGILAVAAFTRFSGYNPIRLNSVAYKLKSDIRSAQQMAVSLRTTRNVNLTSGAYEGVNIDSTNFGGTLQFDPQGRPLNSAGALLTTEGQIQLSDGKGNPRTITIEPDTGKVGIQ